MVKKCPKFKTINILKFLNHKILKGRLNYCIFEFEFILF